MANHKYFHLKHKTTGADHLVKAPKPALALLAIAGAATGAVRAATDDEIRDHFIQGGGLSDRSRSEEGKGRYFFVNEAGQSTHLVRARSEDEAFAAVHEPLYTIEAASQDVLVRLLTASVKPVDYVEPAATKKAPAGTASASDAPATAANDAAPAAIAATG